MARRAVIGTQLPVHVGAERGTGTSVWQVRAYKATPSYPRGYVQYRDVETGAWRVTRPRKGEELLEVFRRVEAAMDANVSLATASPDGEVRNMNALIGRYTDWLSKRGRDSSYVYGRKAMADLWVSRFRLSDGTMFGDLLVVDWDVEHSEEVIAHARTKVSPARVEDIGAMLAGMRKVAQMPTGRARIRWLSPDSNPLEGVEYGRAATHRSVAGAHKNYIEPRLRPSTEMVEAAMGVAPDVAADTHMGGGAWLPLCIAIAGFCGLRQAEQLALRVEDIDLEKRVITVNGRWKYPRNGKPYFRQDFTKTNEIREVAYPASIQHLMVEGVTNARRWLAERAASRPGDGRQLVAWLFPHAVHGVPPTKEQFNTQWLRIRDAVNDAGVPWPAEVKYRNLRHHFAVWANGRGLSWRLVAMLMGDDEQTVRDHYVIAGAEDMDNIRDVFSSL